MEQNDKMKVLRDDNFRKRRRDKGEKEDWKGQKAGALQVFEDQRVDFGKYSKQLSPPSNSNLASSSLEESVFRCC